MRFVPLRAGGSIAYHVYTSPAQRRATYNVTVSRAAAGQGAVFLATEDADAAWFVLRWPHSLLEHSMAGDGCRVVQVESANGLVLVEPQFHNASVAASCLVSGQW